jgi:ABC-type branched-subunit amino acid transport system substrate-binding protein
MTARWLMAIVGPLLASTAGAIADDRIDVVRDLAGRIGPVLGSALACPDIARSRIQVIADKFAAVITEASSSQVTRSDLTRLFDRNVADGRVAVTWGKTDCIQADRSLADLERSIGRPAATAAVTPAAPVAAAPASPAAAPPALSTTALPALATPATTSVAPVNAGPPQRGITDREIRFGMSAPFSGAAKEVGRQMKLGIDVAFNRINDAGGVEGRKLKLIATDDGYEPTRTADNIKQLYEKDQVFGFIGNAGTPNAAVSVPYALERRMLFFGAFTGANVVRHDPPDRYVFNYRVSYAEETDAAVRYLVKMRRLQPRQIAVFAQQDPYGDAGFAGVAKAVRALGGSDEGILRLHYKRNTIDVEDAVNQLRAQNGAIRAIVMVPNYRAAAKFIEKTRDIYPGMIYCNVSGVQGSALADELMLLGPRYANGVIVTQVVPAVSGYSTIVLEYKSALAKYFPGEAPDYVSLEGYVAANVLIQGLKRAGPQFDTEKLVDVLENTRNLDLGLGTSLGFGRAEHQASHKIWGTALDENGKFQAIDLE